MDRRKFIKVAAGGSLAAATGLPTISGTARAGEEKKDAAIRAYNQLGKTNIRMSDISFGGGALASPLLVNKALDMGINYFDTAPDYMGGQSESTLGKIFKDKAKREKVYIATKLCDPKKGNNPPGLEADKVIKGVEASLKRLNTDYIDLMFIHGVEGKNYAQRLNDGEMWKAVDKMKASGMIRCMAVSSHGPSNMEETLKAVIDSGKFDAIMPSMNHMDMDKGGGGYSKLQNVIAHAKEKGVGVVAMKTLAGGKEVDLKEFQKGGDSYEHAAFKWALHHPGVAGLIVTMSGVGQIKGYVEASGKKMSKSDWQILERYAAAHGRDYCRTGCGDCAGACPKFAAIPEILRYEMYFTDYHQEKLAMENYAALPANRNASACIGCDAPCDGGCTFGLNIQKKMLEAHAKLSFPSNVI